MAFMSNPGELRSAKSIDSLNQYPISYLSLPNQKDRIDPYRIKVSGIKNGLTLRPYDLIASKNQMRSNTFPTNLTKMTERKKLEQTHNENVYAQCNKRTKSKIRGEKTNCNRRSKSDCECQYRFSMHDINKRFRYQKNISAQM